MANIKSIGGNPIVPESVAADSVTDAMLAQAGGVLTNKLDATVYRNVTSGTCTQANTFTNFPYKITQGKTYSLVSDTAGNTMSFRTRATADGANIDSVNAVATGAPQQFTATADAAYIRVNSYLANGVFTIVELGTIDNRLDVLEGVAPIVNLPSKLYAVVGKELNVYFDNIVERAGRFTFDVTCTKGRQMARGFSITPIADDVGTYTLTLDVYDGTEKVATATTSLTIVAADAGDGDTATFILMGDSTVNGTDTQIVNNFSTDAMGVTSLGTRGTAPASHEGRTGWTFQYYYNSATVASVANPFYNPSTSKFDAGYYYTQNSITAPDWFFIQLGINDVFTITNDVDLMTKINSCKTQCNHFISSIQAANASTKIGVAVTIPPNTSQDAFGKAYGCGQTRDRYRRNNLLFAQSLIDAYGGMEESGVYLVPILTNLDTTYNMGLESDPVNARNTAITYQSPIANGGVHPVESGYQQLADVYTAFIKAQAGE